MKRLAAALAQTINIERPKVSGKSVGFGDVNEFIRNAITLAFIIAIVLVFIMLVWGAIQWIFSGGNKDDVANARNRIIHALIGLAILALAFAIVQLAATFLGFSLTNITIPTPTS